jgi:hypothetical protein
MEVVPTQVAPARYQIVKPETPIVFPKIGKVTSVSETVSVPSNMKYSELRYQLNSVLDNGAITIAGHGSLQIVQGDKLKILGLVTVAGERFNYFVVRKARDKLFLLGTYSFDKVAILQFTLDGEPVRIDFVPLPSLIRQSKESKRFEFDIQSYGYEIRTYLVDNIERVLTILTLKVELH